MIVATRNGRSAEVRALFANAADIGPFMGTGIAFSVAGPLVGLDSVMGLPAATAAVRLIAETAAMVPLLVYEGDPLERERARATWQWELLHERANPDTSAFDFICDIATSVETTGNAYIWKVKVRRGRVEALYVLDPAMVRVEYDDRRTKTFTVIQEGHQQRYTADTILHIRGWTSKPGALTGSSPIALHRERLGGAIAAEEFENRFYANNATPSGVVEIPGKPPREKIDEMREYWAEHHAGIKNANSPAFLTNDATYKQIGISLEDAQYIEGKAFTVADIARIFRLSPIMLGAAVGAGTSTTGDDFERFLKLDLAPRFRRIEQAFNADDDLFGTGDLFSEFLADAVLRPDIKTRYEAYRLGRQGGWLKPNEIRSHENLPPAEGGDNIQETPVGGAPNANGVTNDAED